APPAPRQIVRSCCAGATIGPGELQDARGTLLSVAAGRMRILITDGGERAALATARSLVAAGYRVYVAARRRSSLAGVSRGVRSWRVRSDALDRPAHYAAEVAAVARAQGVDVLLPVTDPSVEALLEHRNALPEHVLLPFPDLDTYRRASDKAHTLELAGAARRLREKPPAGGVSVYRESIAAPPELVAAGTRLLEVLDWRGVAMVECKRDLATNRYVFMEVNGRLWGSLQLAIDAGVDFPALLVACASGREVAPVWDYQVGVRSRWVWGDVD